ncbi:Pentatricopeptide repeat-containing protein [Platanthera zijinensis]|uniref:Pentatricopeptide repeat-containing protein n=1 Tax=Platanthera zijinensis TaxID=2320716 RepID=A0AAP0BPL8_9ASPA
MSQYSVPAFQIAPPLLHRSTSKTPLSVGRNRFSTPSSPAPAAEHPLLISPEPENSIGTGRSAALRSRLSQLCKEGRIHLARRLFDALPRPVPTIFWNAMLIGYICNSMPDDALRLYHLLNHSPFSSFPGSSLRSDHYTYSSLLKACADSRRLLLGKSIHCRILRLSPAPPTNRVLNNSLLSMYASALDPHRVLPDPVRSLFDIMRKRNVVSWNTLIGWYVRSRRPAIAVAQFRRMLEAGTRPSAISFVNVFPAAASVSPNDGSGRWPHILYGMLIKFGGDSIANVFVVSSAIFMFSEISDIESARLVFDFSVEKNIEVWNTMIGGYVQNTLYEEALSLFLQVLQSDDIVADEVTFLASLMATSQLPDDGLGRQIHAYLIKESSKPLPLIISNALVVMYSRCDDLESALDVFDLMPEKDNVSWNTMVSSFVQKDLNYEGLLLVYEMQKEEIPVDSVAVAAVLSAASNLGCLLAGKETHGYLIRHGIEFDGMLSYLIDMYSKSGSVETARRIFDGDGCEDDDDERDQVTWNAMIAGYMHSENHDNAVSLFRQLLARGRSPNHITVSLILPACDPVGGILAGKQIHGFAVRRDLDSNIFVGTALVDMYSKCGGINYAEKVFDCMKERNRVTYTTMITAFGQHGHGEKALLLFKRMQLLGIPPDAITFVGLISACSYSALVNEGLAVYESMKFFGVSATAEHYCCVVDLLGRAGKVEEAYEFVRDLGESGDHAGVWGALLSACKLHGKYELGKAVSRKLFEMENQNGTGSAGYRVLASNLHAAEGSWDGVDEMRKEMKARGLVKEPGSSWIEVWDGSHRFVSRDRNHPESDRINAMIQGLALDMRSIDDGIDKSCAAYEADDIDR